jgi:hypothetical protein
MIVLNTVSTDKVITGSGMNKKSVRHEVKKSEMTMGCGMMINKMSNMKLAQEKRKPIKFL